MPALLLFTEKRHPVNKFACVMSPFYGKINKYYNSKFNKLFVQENYPDFVKQFVEENK